MKPDRTTKAPVSPVRQSILSTELTFWMNKMSHFHLTSMYTIVPNQGDITPKQVKQLLQEWYKVNQFPNNLIYHERYVLLEYLEQRKNVVSRYSYEPEPMNSANAEDDMMWKAMKLWLECKRDVFHLIRLYFQQKPSYAIAPVPVPFEKNYDLKEILWHMGLLIEQFSFAEIDILFPHPLVFANSSVWLDTFERIRTELLNTYLSQYTEYYHHATYQEDVTKKDGLIYENTSKGQKALQTYVLTYLQPVLCLHMYPLAMVSVTSFFSRYFDSTPSDPAKIQRIKFTIMFTFLNRYYVRFSQDPNKWKETFWCMVVTLVWTTNWLDLGPEGRQLRAIYSPFFVEAPVMEFVSDQDREEYSNPPHIALPFVHNGTLAKVYGPWLKGDRTSTERGISSLSQYVFQCFVKSPHPELRDRFFLKVLKNGTILKTFFIGLGDWTYLWKDFKTSQVFQRKHSREYHPWESHQAKTFLLVFAECVVEGMTRCTTTYDWTNFRHLCAQVFEYALWLRITYQEDTELVFKSLNTIFKTKMVFTDKLRQLETLTDSSSLAPTSVPKAPIVEYCFLHTSTNPKSQTLVSEQVDSEELKHYSPRLCWTQTQSSQDHLVQDYQCFWTAFLPFYDPQEDIVLNQDVKETKSFIGYSELWDSQKSEYQPFRTFLERLLVSSPLFVPLQIRPGMSPIWSKEPFWDLWAKNMKTQSHMSFRMWRSFKASSDTNMLHSTDVFGVNLKEKVNEINMKYEPKEYIAFQQKYDDAKKEYKGIFAVARRVQDYLGNLMRLAWGYFVENVKK